MISPVTASVSSLRFASSGVRWLDISVKPTRSDWASVCQWTWWNGETDMDLYGNMKVRQLTMEWTMKWNMEGNYIYMIQMEWKWFFSATLICRVQETFLQKHVTNPCPVVDHRLARCNGGHVIFVGRQWRVLSRSFCVYIVLC